MKYLLVVPDDTDPATAKWAPTLGVEADSPESDVTDVFSVPDGESDVSKAKEFILGRKLTVPQALASSGSRGLGYIATEDGFCVASLQGPIVEEDQFVWRDLNRPGGADGPDDGQPYTNEDFAKDQQDGLSS